MLGFMGAWVGSIQKKNILLTKLRPTSFKKKKKKKLRPTSEVGQKNTPIRKSMKKNTQQAQ